MSIGKTIAIAVLPCTMLLAGCSGSAPTSKAALKSHAAHLYVLDDVSGSSAVQGDDAFGKGIRQRIVDQVRSLSLGDTITVYEVGGSSADRFVGLPTIATGYQLGLNAAAKKVGQQLDDIAVQFRAEGGDGGTRILQTLNNLHPDCTVEGTKIIVASDGIEESEGTSVSAALNAGKSLELPPLSSGALTGCRVTMLGLGVSSNGGTGQVLPDTQLNALRSAWRKLLIGAGASEVTFTSLI